MGAGARGWGVEGVPRWRTHHQSAELLRSGQFNVLQIYGTEFCRIHAVDKGGFERDSELQSSIDGNK